MSGSTTIGAPPPPTIEKEYGGGDSGWALLCVAADRYEAEIIRGALDASEIRPVVLQPIPTSVSWMHPSDDQQAPHRVLVLATAIEAAKLALMEIGLEASLEVEEPEKPGEVPKARWVSDQRIRITVTVTMLAAIGAYVAQLIFQGRANFPR